MIADFLKYKRQIAIVALGGNAILRKEQTPEPETQCANIAHALKNLEKLVELYDAIALTHGNGPQVGNDLIRSHAAKQLYNLPRISLADCDANTQGRIGHWIIREMKRNPLFGTKKTACLITHIYVDKMKFTPDEYTKYVGPWLNSSDIDYEKAGRRGIVYKAPDGQNEKVRRVVPSPMPYRIEEIETINRLLNSGVITICCGGGGVPVYDPGYEGNRDTFEPNPSEKFIPSDVVIDKDWASAVLAASLLEMNPDIDVHLIILTDVKGLYRTSKLKDEDYIDEMSLKELDSFIAQNTLDPGSIKPKLEAIRYFLKKGGKQAFLGNLDDFVPEKNGTRFYSVRQIELFRTA
jgi:carbamate kinase